MDHLFLIYLQNSVWLSAAALPLLFFSSILSRRYAAGCRYYLWTILLVALLLPVRPEFSLPLPDFLQSARPVIAGTAAQPSADASLFSRRPENQTLSGTFPYIAACFWLLGAICFALRQFCIHIRFLSLIKRWGHPLPSGSPAASVMEQLKADLGINRSITVRICPFLHTPMMTGLFRPLLLLPCTDFTQEELPYIIKHELIHCRRRDIWYKLLMLSALTIHWFNPIVHLIVKSASLLCEISCDEAVTAGLNTNDRIHYGQTILRQLRNSQQCRTALSAGLYSGKRNMQKRIYSIMDMQNKQNSPVLPAVVFAAAVCGLTAFSFYSSGIPLSPPVKASGLLSGSLQAKADTDAGQDSPSDRTSLKNRPESGSVPVSPVLLPSDSSHPDTHESTDISSPLTETDYTRLIPDN